MSIILNLIQDNSWANVLSLMKEKDIKVKTKNNLAIFNYGPGADFSDPIVCEARGIIIDRQKGVVVCRGFDKFFNFSETYAAAINWKTACVQEKLDGSIIKLYWYDGKWHWATNGMIDAEDADITPVYGIKSYMDVIRRCNNFPYIEYEKLDHKRTYIFELTSPYNRSVISYSIPLLYHIGTRNNETGKESEEDIGIIRPKRYPLHSLNDCITAAAELNRNKDQCTNEGFVVVDAAYNRIKIKTPEYVLLHHAVDNHTLSEKRALELLENEDFNKEAFLREFPEYTELFNHVIRKREEVYENCRSVIRTARQLWTEAENADDPNPRKYVWEHLKDNPYAFVGMMAIGDRSERSTEEIMMKINSAKLRDLMFGK